jgi:SNF2 family DNA or RNA helicase
MYAKATLHEDKIVLRTFDTGSFFDRALAKCKDVPGARWRKADKWWQYPASVETCHRLRQIWGDELQVSPVLAEWYIEQKQAHDERAQMASELDATLHRLPEVAPRLFAALRPDQRLGVAWVARGYRGGGLLCDEPGLGKTLEAIGGVLEADVQGPVLVVCPKLSVKPVWYRELKRWTHETVYIARGTRRQREKAIEAFRADTSRRKFLVIVAEMLRVKEEVNEDTGKKVFAGYEYPQLFQSEWSAAIIDESHKLFGSLTVVKGNLAGKGLKRLPVSDDPSRICRLAATGTPFGKGGRLTGMFGTLHWLWPDEFTSFWRWAGMYFEIEDEDVYIKGGRGQTRTTKRIVGLREGTGEEFLKSFGPRILRRTKAEVLPDLPPKQYVEVLCEMSGAQLRQYKQLSDEAEVVTRNGVVTANGVLAELTRAKQIANGAIDTDGEQVYFTGESGKLDMLMQLLEQRGIVGDTGGDVKVIVASQFNMFLKQVEDRLNEAGVDYHIITGATSDTKRDAEMAAFQGDGGHRVFLLNAKAGGISVTLDAADEVHCLDELWNPEDQQQLEDRAHRASRMHQVTIYHYRTEGTVDQHIAEEVEGKRLKQHEVLDGRRGLEYARNLIRYQAPEE